MICGVAAFVHRRLCLSAASGKRVTQKEHASMGNSHKEVIPMILTTKNDGK